ncbi:MAG TPA: hypothetical protein VES59_10845 [Bacteroidota bacterium]|nr:hypothetical protein [Bacteroidota bacterium]
MTEKEFMRRVSNGNRDVLQELIDILERNDIAHCVIGGLAVNAYAEPVVSLDLDIVIAAKDTDKLLGALPKDFVVRVEKHSTNISTPGSDLRIQIQSDPRYQPFIGPSQRRKVLGYNLPVATVEDVLKGKVWAYSDPERRASKRQKDLADIMRLIEMHPDLVQSVPPDLRKKLSEKP